MNIVIVSGSHRRASQSARIARYLASRLPALEAESVSDIVDLAGNPLPLWDESAWEAGSALAKQWEPYAKRLRAADAFVMVSPEWHGMVPSGLKNFLLFCSARDVGHKPALIVTVSSSRGGAYPVNELRTSGYKNTRICYIPEHIIVRDCEKMFVGDTPANEDDGYLRGRTDFALRALIAYARALRPVWEGGALFDKNYPFGM